MSAERFHPKPVIKVVHIVGPLAWGGAEHQVVELATAHHPAVEPLICTLGAEGPRAPTVRAEGVEIFPVSVRVRQMRAGVRSIADVVTMTGADVLHAHTATNGTWAQLVARRTGLPFLFSEYGFNSARSLKHTFLEGTRTRSAARVIANSEALRSELVSRTKVDPSRVHVVHSGVDLKRFPTTSEVAAIRTRLGVPEDGVLFGTIARVEQVKGHRYLIDAAREVTKAMPSAHFVVVRHLPTDLEEELQKQVDALGLHDRFRFVTPDDVAAAGSHELLAAFDVFVLSSLSESLPISIIEAMASHIPVVATDVGGVKEVLAHRKTGLLVPPKDPDALAIALLKMAGDADLRRAFGDNGRRRAEGGFSTERLIEGTVAVYRKTLTPR